MTQSSFQKQRLTYSGQHAVCSDIIQVVTWLPKRFETCSGQEQYKHLLNRKQRMAAKMKQEQKDIQQFSHLMKSMLQDRTDSIANLQDKLVKVRMLSVSM